MVQNDVLDTSKLEGLIQGREEGRAEGKALGIAEGRAEGRAEGIAEGRAEGRTEGRAEGLAEVARNFLTMGFSIDQVSKGTGLSIEEVSNLQSSLGSHT